MSDPRFGSADSPDSVSCTVQGRSRVQQMIIFNDKYSHKYCHNSRRDCGNAGPLKAGIDVTIVLRTVGRTGQESSTSERRDSVSEVEEKSSRIDQQ